MAEVTYFGKKYFLKPYESFPSWTGDSVCGADARLSLCTDPLKICDKKFYLGRWVDGESDAKWGMVALFGLSMYACPDLNARLKVLQGKLYFQKLL